MSKLVSIRNNELSALSTLREDRKFGTDGIRGPVTSTMNPLFVTKLGWAAGSVIKEEGISKVLIGKDTRISGYMFESALQAGFISAGMDVTLLGPLPTPGVSYLAHSNNQVGLVISASHNLFEDNGIKSKDEYEKCNNLEKILTPLSAKRNSKIINPLMDLTDINYFEALGSISAAKFMKRISRRYDLDAWLLCTIKDEFGLLLDSPLCFTSQGRQSSPSEALNYLLDRVNSKKSLVVDKKLKNKTSIRIVGITNLSFLENVLNNLKSQVLVYGVSLQKVEGDKLDILLSHYGKSEDLKNLLNINDDFIGIDNSSREIIAYKYNNS